MSTSLRDPTTIDDLYAAVEQMHSTELQRMTTAVREAQQAISVEQECGTAARMMA